MFATLVSLHFSATNFFAEIRSTFSGPVLSAFRIVFPHKTLIAYRTKSGYYVRAHFDKKGNCVRKDYYRSFDEKKGGFTDLLFTKKQFEERVGQNQMYTLCHPSHKATIIS